MHKVIPIIIIVQAIKMTITDTTTDDSINSFHTSNMKTLDFRCLSLKINLYHVTILCEDLFEFYVECVKELFTQKYSASIDIDMIIKKYSAINLRKIYQIRMPA